MSRPYQPHQALGREPFSTDIRIREQEKARNSQGLTDRQPVGSRCKTGRKRRARHPRRHCDEDAMVGDYRNFARMMEETSPVNVITFSAWSAVTVPVPQLGVIRL